MKILIHAQNSFQNKNLDIELQAETLCTELEKAGHTIEWSNQTHPARLLLNKYDALHILTEKMPLSFKNFLIVMTAKALGLPVIITSYGLENLTYPKASLANFQLSYFDAMSVPEANEIKNLRPFHHTKFIWPALPPKINPLNTEKKLLPLNVIFHVDKNFLDLPEVKWSLDKNIYVDGTKLTARNSQSSLRSSWNLFCKKNPIYKNALLILNESNLKKIMSENKSLFLINYLRLHSISLSTIIHNCIQYQSALVLNENQASGLPDLWSHQKNGLVQNFDKNFVYQLSFTDLVEKIDSLDFEKNNSLFLESKINELSRIYFKIKTQKELKISYANMPRRS